MTKPKQILLPKCKRCKCNMLIQYVATRGDVCGVCKVTNIHKYPKLETKPNGTMAERSKATDCKSDLK